MKLQNQWIGVLGIPILCSFFLGNLAMADPVGSHLKQWPEKERPPRAIEEGRDPFQSPILGIRNQETGALQKFDLSELTPKAIVWGVNSPVALIEDPEKAEYFLRVGDPIGKAKGIVLSIDQSCIVVQETYVDWLGRSETQQYCMYL